MATLLLAHNCKSPRIFFNSFAPLVSTLSAAHGACDGNTRSSWLWVQQQFRQQQYATAAADAQQGVPLKTALRQLYKRVHPDLFTDYPAEQVRNNMPCIWLAFLACSNPEPARCRSMICVSASTSEQ